MCGRFTLVTTLEEIKKNFNVTNSVLLAPRYNIAPGQPILVIKPDKLLDFSIWNFKPHWMKSSDKYPASQGFINARIETAADKPSFKHSLKYSRCIILASGYYEWGLINGKKQPFYIYPENQNLIAFAGIYSGDTCCILTKAADVNLSKIHDRMPVILSADDYNLWLNARSLRTIESEKILDNTTSNLLIHKVTIKVGNPVFDEKTCITPI